MKESLAKTEEPRLRFDSHEDALNYIYEFTEGMKQLLSLQHLGTFESYVEGKVDIVLRIAFGPEEFDLIFHAIPNQVALNDIGSERTVTKGQVSDGSRSDQEMLVHVTYMVEGPEKIVSTLVRLEPAKARLNLLRHIFTLSERVNEVNGITGERESAMFRVLCSRCSSRGVANVIECGSEIINGISRDERERDRQGLRESDLVAFVSRLSIGLDDFFVRTFVEKGSDFKFKILDVVLCPVDLDPRTFEQVSY
jgi:hypothetical protein